MEKIKKIFSYTGTMNRVEFLLYGLLLPIVIYMSFYYSSIYIKSAPILLIGYLLTFYIAIVSALKRAYEASWSTILLMILYLVLPYIGVWFLLFQGEAVRNKFYIREEEI